jgi:hypothetical protein
MGVQRGARECCGLNNREVVEYVGLEHVGASEVSWLVEEDGGEDERESRGVPCLGRSCCWFLNKFETRFLHICMSVSNGYLQALEDKEERACYSTFHPEGCQSAGEVKVVVW